MAFPVVSMETPPPQKKLIFSEKPYLYSWPANHSVRFDPSIHKIPFLGLITNTPQILALEEAAMTIVGDTKSAKQIENALKIQTKFGAYEAVPRFIGYCEWQKARKQHNALKNE